MTTRTAPPVIKMPGFALSLDPILDGNILTAIQSELNGSDHDELEARISKLNIYPTGGFFKVHCE
jgi:hypothetical protein